MAPTPTRVARRLRGLYARTEGAVGEWRAAGEALRAAVAALIRALARLPVMAAGLEGAGRAGELGGGVGALEALGARQVAAAGRLAERAATEARARECSAGEVRRCARAARDVLRAELGAAGLPAEGTPEHQRLREGGGALPSALAYVEGLEEVRAMLQDQAELDAAVLGRLIPGVAGPDAAELLQVLEEESCLDWGRVRELLDLGLVEVEDF